MLVVVVAVIGVGVLLVVRPFSPAADASPEQAIGPASSVLPSVAPTLLSSTPAPTPAPTFHVVASGDTLRSIAERYLGDESLWERIYEANRDAISDPERLVVGQTLEIPAR